MRMKFAIGIMCLGLASGVAPLAASQAAATKQPPAKTASKPAPKAPKSIDLSKLPAPVRATIEAEAKNATLKNVAKETEKGQTQYEVETIVNGKTRDFLVDPAGKVIEVEEEIAISAAPQPVQDALKTHGKVLRLETVLKDGKTTYEASVQGKNGKKSSVALDAEGKPVKG
jgi:uncharacterized membrane protein YkoI